MQETWVRSLGWEDPLEKEVATCSSILAWEIPRTEEPAGLQSMGSQGVGHDFVAEHTCSLQSKALRQLYKYSPHKFKVPSIRNVNFRWIENFKEQAWTESWKYKTANRYILHYGWRKKISPQKYHCQKFFIPFFPRIRVAVSMGRNGIGNNQQSESESCSVVSDSLWSHGLYSPWNSPGQNTGVGCHSLLQGIFPTQEPNSGLSHCRWILYQLSHQGNPRTLEWVAYPFSSGPSQPGGNIIIFGWSEQSYL